MLADVSLTCDIVIAHTDVAWFRGPTLLEDDAEGTIEIQRHRDKHILRLYDVQKSSFYSCTALNAYGEASHQFRLSIRKGNLKITTLRNTPCLNY